MQQFFVDTPLTIGETYSFTKEQEHHLAVVRMKQETIRLVYQGEGYFALVQPEGKHYSALVQEKDSCKRDCPMEIILCMAMIRKEPFELVLQKATELGVKKILPFVSSRCNTKADPKKQERYETIVKEAAQQCKRDSIPKVLPCVSFEQLKEVQGDICLAAYEDAGVKASTITSSLKDASSCVIVIGPEGGFSLEEVSFLQGHGYTSITLGRRILRAETAAIAACSILAECAEGKR